jgi:hypothetical protein
MKNNFFKKNILKNNYNHMTTTAKQNTQDLVFPTKQKPTNEVLNAKSTIAWSFDDARNHLYYA